MTTFLFVYFWVNNFSGYMAFLATLLCLPAIGLMLWAIASEDCDPKESPRLIKNCKRVFMWAIIFHMLNALPGIKQMSMIFGIPAAVEIMKNPEVAKIPNNVLQIINQELEEKITKKEKSQ
jgi:hypothetical protein